MEDYSIHFFNSWTRTNHKINRETLENKSIKRIAILGDESFLKRSSEQHPLTNWGPEAATEATALIRMDTHCDWKFLSGKALRSDDETRC